MRHPARAGILAAVLPRARVTHRTHNKRMRITNASVRYRVSGDNYIGRKNDTELRASRWQREITLAMHFFSSLTREKLSCETAYTARSFLNAAKRHGATCLSLSLSLDFVFPASPSPAFSLQFLYSLQLIISILKYTVRHFLSNFSYLTTLVGFRIQAVSIFILSPSF